MQQASWVLAGEVGSVARARSLLADELRAVPDQPREIVLLLAHELVANAVLHSQGQVLVRAWWEWSAVRVEVEDASTELPVLREVDPSSPSGRGVMIVDSLSREWGVTPTPSGKVVWFTV